MSTEQRTAGEMRAEILELQERIRRLRIQIRFTERRGALIARREFARLRNMLGEEERT